MTVKELKKALENIPEDSTVFLELEGDMIAYEQAEDVLYSPICNTVKLVSFVREG